MPGDVAVQEPVPDPQHGGGEDIALPPFLPSLYAIHQFPAHSGHLRVPLDISL